MNFALQDNAKFGFIISNFWQKVKNSRVNFIYSSVVDILFIYLETKGIELYRGPANTDRKELCSIGFY